MRVNQIATVPILGPMPGPWGKAIFRLRAERGWNQQKAAKKARITPTTYGRIEKGGHTRTSKLQQIADAFSVDITAVLVPDRPDVSSLSVRDVIAQLVREETTSPAADKLHTEMNRATEEMERDASTPTPAPKRVANRKKMR